METVRVGIGVIIFKNGRMLLGKRKNAHGDGEWALAGGHLEVDETFAECAKREAMEEAGIKIKNIKLVTVTNDIFKKEKKHYVTIFMRSEYSSGILRNMEPEKLEKWGWFSPDNLPTPLFTPIRNLLKTHKIK